MKCICKQIAELTEKCGCKRIKVCSHEASFSGEVDSAATKEADGILVMKDAMVKFHHHDCGCAEEHLLDCIGVAGRHIICFRCDDY